MKGEEDIQMDKKQREREREKGGLCMRQIKLNESQSTQLSLSPFHFPPSSSHPSSFSFSSSFFLLLSAPFSLHFRCHMDNNIQCGQNELIETNNTSIEIDFNNIEKNICL